MSGTDDSITPGARRSRAARGPLAQPTALFADVMAAVAKDHREGAPECKSDMIISSEEAPARPLPAIFGSMPRASATRRAPGPGPAGEADRVVVGQMSAVTKGSCGNRRLWRAAGLDGGQMLLLDWLQPTVNAGIAL